MAGVSRKEWERMTGIDINQEVEKAMREYVTRDSGEREDFMTGSRRDVRRGKGRYDLIWWPMVERLAGLMERGAEKYGERNWELGQPVSRSFDSLIRHARQLFMREDDEDHAAAVWFNAMSMAYVIVMVRLGYLPAELDDRPNKP